MDIGLLSEKMEARIELQIEMKKLGLKLSS
jgi:hypothetical protein